MLRNSSSVCLNGSPTPGFSRDPDLLTFKRASLEPRRRITSNARRAEVSYRECRCGDEAGAAPALSWSRSTVLRMIVGGATLGGAGQAPPPLLPAETRGNPPRRHLAA